MTYRLWNLISAEAEGRLTEALEQHGFALRHLDTLGVDSADAFRSRAADTFSFPTGGGWQSVADDLGEALFPDDDEGSKVALVWRHADAMLPQALGAFIDAMDILRDIGRAAYVDEVEIITFALGAGPGFEAGDIAELFGDSSD